MYQIVDAAGKVSRSQVCTFTDPRGSISILEELKLSTTLKRNSQQSGYAQKEANIQIAVEADGIRGLLNTTINLAGCMEPCTKTIILQQEPRYLLTYKIRICLQEQLRRISQYSTKKVQFAMLSPTKNMEEEVNPYGLSQPKEIRSANFIEDHLSPRPGLASSKSAKSIGEEGEHKKRANSHSSKGVESMNSISVKCVQKREKPEGKEHLQQKIARLDKDSRELRTRITFYEEQMLSLKEQLRRERVNSQRLKGEIEQLHIAEKLEITAESKTMPLAETEARKLREHLGYLEGFQLELKTENQMLEEDLKAKKQKIKHMLILAAEAEKQEMLLKTNLSEQLQKNEKLQKIILKTSSEQFRSPESKEVHRGDPSKQDSIHKKEEASSKGKCTMCLELTREIQKLKVTISKLNNPNESTTNQELLQNEIMVNKLKRQLEISTKNERNLLIQKSHVETKCKNWEAQMMKSKMALAKIVNAVQEAGSQELKEEINQLIL